MKFLNSYEEYNDISSIKERASLLSSVTENILEREYVDSFAVYEFLNLRNIFRAIFVNPGIKRKIKNLVEELVKTRVEIAKISLEYEPDDFESEYDYDYDYGRKAGKRNYKQTRETSPSELKKSTLEDQILAIEAQMELLAGEDEKMIKFLDLQRVQARLNANELIYKLASDEQQKILNKYNRLVKKDINNMADGLEESLDIPFTHILFEEFYHITSGKIIKEGNINMRYIKTFESFISEKKEFYIEVSVRDARKALDHLEDMHRRKYETDGSNYYIFKDEDEAYDALQHFKGMGLEVEDHNVNEALNEATFAEEDEIATYEDPSGEDGLTHIMKRKGGYYGYNDNFDFYAKDKKELKGKLNSWGYKLIAGKI